jgi:hypothetical protein
LVLHFPQPGIVVRAEVAGGRLRPEQFFARLLQLLGAQQASDMVGTERRLHRPPILSLAWAISALPLAGWAAIPTGPQGTDLYITHPVLACEKSTSLDL